MRVEIADDGRGRREAVKRAEGPDEAARLRRESDLLDVATHPGLVEVIGFDDGPGPVLRTAYVGASLADERPLDVDETAGVVAAVATTLADLHALGLVHGAVLPSHVLLDGGGRPVLCGLGYGGLAGERPASATLADGFTDPARLDDGILDPAGDVFALGSLVLHLLACAPGAGRGSAAEELRRIADRATSPAGRDRPTARQVADAVHDTVPGARLPWRGDPPGAPPPPLDPLAARRRRRPLEHWRRTQRQTTATRRHRREPRRRRTAVGALAVGAAVAAAVIVLLRAGPHGLEASPSDPVIGAVAAPDTVAEGPTTTLGAVARRPPPTRPARSGCPAVDGPMTADVDGDGCAEAIRYSGGTIEAGAWRWAVGEADDVAAVGDWLCSGTRSLALLRPRTGEVFAFTGWATAGHDLAAPMTAQVVGGRALRVADLDGDGCNELVVERSSGAPAVVRVKPASP